MRTKTVAMPAAVIGAVGGRAIQAPAPTPAPSGLPSTSKNAASESRLRITIGDKTIEATLADSEAARDFASLLPLTLALNDLFRREKFATLPRAISEDGKRTHDYAV